MQPVQERSPNQHFLFARVAYREEFVLRFENEASFYSCDDMNKIKMGPLPAVSQYHQQKRFFMNDDNPNFNDHDFPNLGYLLVSSGDQMLVSKEKIDPKQEEFFGHELHNLVPYSNNADV